MLCKSKVDQQIVQRDASATADANALVPASSCALRSAGVFGGDDEQAEEEAADREAECHENQGDQADGAAGVAGNDGRIAQRPEVASEGHDQGEDAKGFGGLWCAAGGQEQQGLNTEGQQETEVMFGAHGLGRVIAEGGGIVDLKT
jgi:hypothetical protein